MYTSGKLPLRARGVDPGLLTKGNGKYEWRGFLSKNKHIHGTDPRDGTITNWNNIPARGFGAADDDWGSNGSAARVDLLDYNLDRLKRNGKWSLASVIAAMNAAATQDVRAIDTVPLLQRLLKGSSAPTPQAEQMLALLGAWRANGGSRLDRDLDGADRRPRARRSWTRRGRGSRTPASARASRPTSSRSCERCSRAGARRPSGQKVHGWYQYLDRDIRTLLGERVPQAARELATAAGASWAGPRTRSGRRSRRRASSSTAEQGTADPSAWRADATAERIEFVPGLLPTTMRYTNRPSGIQQVISFGD